MTTTQAPEQVAAPEQKLARRIHAALAALGKPVTDDALADALHAALAQPIASTARPSPHETTSVLAGISAAVVGERLWVVSTARHRAVICGATGEAQLTPAIGPRRPPQGHLPVTVTSVPLAALRGGTVVLLSPAAAQALDDEAVRAAVSNVLPNQSAEDAAAATLLAAQRAGAGDGAAVAAWRPPTGVQRAFGLVCTVLIRLVHRLGCGRLLALPPLSEFSMFDSFLHVTRPVRDRLRRAHRTSDFAHGFPQLERRCRRIVLGDQPGALPAGVTPEQAAQLFQGLAVPCPRAYAEPANEVEYVRYLDDSVDATTVAAPDLRLRRWAALAAAQRSGRPEPATEPRQSYVTECDTSADGAMATYWAGDSLVTPSAAMGQTSRYGNASADLDALAQYPMTIATLLQAAGQPPDLAARPRTMMGLANCELAGQIVESLSALSAPDRPEQVRGALRHALDLTWARTMERRLADANIYFESYAPQSTGCTDQVASALAAVEFRGYIYFANLGECRAVLCRGTRATRLTVDHVRDEPSEERRCDANPALAPYGLSRGLLLWADSGVPQPKAQVTRVRLGRVRGHTLLLLPRGITRVLGDGDVAGIVQQCAGTASDVARAVTLAALARGATGDLACVAWQPPAVHTALLHHWRHAGRGTEGMAA